VAGRPLSVVHVTQATEAGVARITLDLVSDQARRGFSVAVACPASGPLAPAVIEAGADHAEWRARRSPGLSSLAETRALAGILGARAPDLVHLHSSKAGLAGRLALRGRRPTVFEPNGWSFLAVDGPARAAALRWERFAARYADVVVCVSEGERRLGEELRVRGRFEVVPNAVDLTVHRQASDSERHAARASLGVLAGPLVVCVGRLSRQKGQDVLLDAWPRVRTRVTEARLALVGDGPERDALAMRADESVLLPGARSDVSAWLAAADVVALPSRWEGMALTMLEAMATGRSVIASDVAGARDALGHGGGALVPPEDPSALADAIAERLLDPALTAAEGDVGRAVAEQRHDVRRRMDAVVALYENVLEDRRSVRGGA
jgi:glycosyltransferase involved in cell wall biosynthesis